MKICDSELVKPTEINRNIYRKSNKKNVEIIRHTFMSNPEGLIHSKANIENVAACIATTPTIIHEAVSNGSMFIIHTLIVLFCSYEKMRFKKNKNFNSFYIPKNAVGEMIPVRLVTAMDIPVSINGKLKSTTDSRSEFIINDVITISVFLFTNSDIKPFHFPF